MRDYVRVLRAHWVGVTLIVTLAVASVALYTLAQPKVYQANASGFVSTGPNYEPGLGSVNDQFAKSRAVSYVTLAESRATAREVIRELKLDVSPDALVNSIDVLQPESTVNIRITARAGTPQQARALADAWVAALAQQIDEIEDPEGIDPVGSPVLVPVESAALPAAPISPQPLRNVLIGLAVGFVLGLGYALVRNVLDRRLRTAASVVERFGVNVLGSIPSTPVLGHGTGERATLITSIESSDASGAGEAFRKLRTNLRYMAIDDPPRIIVVTSPKPSDGKSTVSTNLAAAMAVSGRHVVLVDADLRRPSVATALGVVEGVGLTDVLVGQMSPADALQPSGVHDLLQVMGAGRIPPNPSELLGSQSMKTLVEKLSQDAMVILDAPPLLPVTDAAVLTAWADGAIIVISAGQTLDGELRTALGHLEAVNARALGVILNKVPRRGANGGTYAGYYSDPYGSSQPKAGTAGWWRQLKRKPRGGTGGSHARGRE
ncbi:polysaccharide biosynthesis tyrosine autokinase [Nocardioides sp. HDW12B]|uniref:polysaccharide biosynthesis tyrosine autokinase n=1 Tax=Nocardioides sp. HDW12B TaxID=2714939 RepID=UPI00140AFB14|nr:polysaccharide biosynthesis tyrosine autokinase [Nocardioides sp. HDW12B]QIK64949.1 polysaccharide biosynthesis tyrosine autokinase [Nocardioides sp. HDW12B]